MRVGRWAGTSYQLYQAYNNNTHSSEEMMNHHSVCAIVQCGTRANPGIRCVCVLQQAIEMDTGNVDVCVTPCISWNCFIPKMTQALLLRHHSYLAVNYKVFLALRPYLSLCGQMEECLGRTGRERTVEPPT